MALGLPSLNNSILKAPLISRNKATYEEIQNHLAVCDGLFLPSLSSRVDIDTYALKLFTKAVNFEAWNEGKLIGLVSAYLGDLDRKSGFISNVSIISAFARQGIAKTLLLQCFGYAQSMKFSEIELEVFAINTAAIDLYLKMGFKKVDSNDEVIRFQFELK